MSGEEGTGLHAFDDIDPISTVSALNVMPDSGPLSLQFGSPDDAELRLDASEVQQISPRLPPPPGARRTSAPPPPPRRAGAASSLPPPPPRRAGASSLPPPALPGLGARSAPPPVPPVSAQAPSTAEMESSSELDQDTKVVPNAFSHDPEFAPTTASARAKAAAERGEGFESFDDAAGDDNASTSLHGQPPSAQSGQARAGIDDTALLELSATTVATNMDMEWDEEEVETKLRDESGVEELPRPLAAPPGARPSPFPPPASAPVSASGRPSPFAAPPTGFAPMTSPQDDWEDEDDAMTRVISPSARPTASAPVGWQPAPAVGPSTSSMPTLVGGELARRLLAGNRLAWLGFAAVALAAFAVAAWAFRAGRATTITLVTKPTDAAVLIDGNALTGQSSPFTVQGLAPGNHTVEVRREGFTSQTHRFRVEPGEVKAMPSIELVPQRLDTGFSLASAPQGATIYVDGHKLDQVTPARVVDLAQGLHVVRLEGGTGYQPWETQVALASGQVIELPTARLAPAVPSAAPKPPAAEPEASQPTESSHHHHHHASSASPVQYHSSAASRPVRESAAAASGGQGTLRINSRPWSQVFVDGRMIGNTPQLNLPLSSGSHHIKLVNPQLGMSKTLSVRVGAGQVVTKIVQLGD